MRVLAFFLLLIVSENSSSSNDNGFLVNFRLENDHLTTNANTRFLANVEKLAGHKMAQGQRKIEIIVSRKIPSFINGAKDSRTFWVSLKVFRTKGKDQFLINSSKVLAQLGQRIEVQSRFLDRGKYYTEKYSFSIRRYNTFFPTTKKESRRSGT